jgi:hypothetical protein
MAARHLDVKTRLQGEDGCAGGDGDVAPLHGPPFSDPWSGVRSARRKFCAAAAIATKGNRSERDLRHSVNTQAAYRAALRLASLPEDAMDLSTKLKITAVMAAVLMAVVWAVPVPV